MNYIGSKHKLIPFIENSIMSIIDKDCEKFCDLFAGTGIVGTNFKSKGYSVIANDIQYYSYILNRHYIGNHKQLLFNNLINHIPNIEKANEKQRKYEVCDYLDNIAGIEGFIFDNYCKTGNKNSEFERLYFSDTNGKKCDGIRQKIESWYSNFLINKDEYFFLLASLIESIDKSANTASVYGAYLKKIKKSASKIFKFLPAKLIINDKEHKVFNEDANELVKNIQCDIIYLDPPYNHRQYAANYHILETIAKYDNPEIFGKAGIRDYSRQKSSYCQKALAAKSLEQLINDIDAKYIFLSYNNEGIIPFQTIKDILSKKGEYGFFKHKHTRFKADSDVNRNHKANYTIEYLHYVKVNK